MSSVSNTTLPSTMRVVRNERKSTKTGASESKPYDKVIIIKDEEDRKIEDSSAPTTQAQRVEDCMLPPLMEAPAPTEDRKTRQKSICKGVGKTHPDNDLMVIVSRMGDIQDHNLWFWIPADKIDDEDRKMVNNIAMTSVQNLSRAVPDHHRLALLLFEDEDWWEDWMTKEQWDHVQQTSLYEEMLPTVKEPGKWSTHNLHHRGCSLFQMQSPGGFVHCPVMWESL